MTKFYFIIILFLCHIRLLSQEFCTYGDYDFCLQKIKGIDTLDISKILLIDLKKKDTICEYKYSKNNLTDVFIKNDPDFGLKRYKLNYTISENRKKDGLDYVSRNYYNNRITRLNYRHININFTYYKDFSLKEISKNCINSRHEFFWNKDKTIKKIKISPYKNSFEKNIYFVYKGNKILKIQSVVTTLNDNSLSHKDEYLYFYKNNRISKIESTRVYNNNDKYRNEYIFSYESDYKISIVYSNKKRKLLYIKNIK